MHKSLTTVLSIAALVIVSLEPSVAADIRTPVYKAAPAPILPVWAGLYLGPTAGWTFGSAKGDYLGAFIPPPPAPPVPTTVAYQFNAKPSGAALGGLIGYNALFGNWLVGLEGDVSWIADASQRVWDPGGSARYDQIDLLWTGHVRGRVGYVFDQYLLFASGGVAFAGIKASHFGPFAGAGQIWSESPVRTGYSVGGGFERAFANKWSFRFEYLYDHFDNKQYVWVPGTRTSNSDLTTNTVRVSFIYRPM